MPSKQKRISDELKQGVKDWLERAKEEFDGSYKDLAFEDEVAKDGIIRRLVVAHIQIRFLVIDKIAKQCLDAWLHREAG